MSKVLVIGAGGVAKVALHKMSQRRDVFTYVLLASRTLKKCESIRDQLPVPIQVQQLDADDSSAVANTIRSFQPDLVVNLALPYQDLSIMDACLETGVHYMDTANYEPPDVAHFEYKWQWAYRERYRQRGITAVLGCGFDPGMTGIYCAYASKHLFDEIESVDIYDCNDGQHGYPFATNFNAEVNIREVTAPGRFYEDGEWHEVAAFSMCETFDFPEVGPRKSYLIYHEELESLAVNLPGVKRLRFWMTFSDRYLNYLRVLEDVGMTGIQPVDYEGHPVIPLKLLASLLPNPADLAPRYKGKTCIGCLVEGKQQGRRKRVFIYNVSDHEQAYRETGSQAISYTTGVPAACGAMMLLRKQWSGPGVFNVEELDPDCFMAEIGDLGLPWSVTELSD